MNTFIFLTTVWMLAISTVVNADDDDFNECFMEDPTDCPYSDLTTSTAIYPGNNTRCYTDTKEDGSDNPYFFQVTPGTSSNLIIYFQGGGACMSEQGCANGGSRRSPEVVGKKGLFADGDSNKYAGWTAVKILYCSGDVHLGNNVDGETHFKGRVNVLSVLDWMTLNIVDAPENVIIVGTSAGGSGAAAWSNRMLQFVDSFDPTPTATVIIDSAMPGGKDSLSSVTSIGFCKDTDTLTDLGYATDSGLCDDGTTLQDYLMLTQATYPDVAFAFVFSKQDPTLVKNFCEIYTGDFCTQSAFYDNTKDTLKEYHDARGNENNVLTYLINRRLHVATTNDGFFFPSSQLEKLTNPDTWFQQELDVWLARVVLREESFSIKSACGPWFTFIPPWPLSDLFCDLSLTDEKFNS